MGRLERSWRLFKTAFAVLLEHKKLLVLAALESAALFVIWVFFFLAVAVCAIAENSGVSEVPGDAWDGVMSQMRTGALLAAPFYFLAMFAASFINTAFYSETMQAMNGGEVSLRRGLRLARSKALQIFVWSFFAGLVGYAIQWLESKADFFGRIVLGLLGTAWSVAAVFAIPVIVREEESVNPLAFLRRSASIVKKTWGESLCGYAGISGIQLLLTIPLALVFAVPAGFVFHSASVSRSVDASGHIATLLTLVALFIASASVLAIVCKTVEKIYICSLYVYATEGAAPGLFDKADLDSAWKTAKRGEK